MPLPFNKNLDLKLLKLVKENPILYNTKHSKYLDFDSREVVWQKIGDSLSRPAVEFAGIHCQIHFGDYQEKKHKPGFLENLEEYLPKQYSNAWGVEKKILKAYSQHQGLSHLEAKYLYIKTARDLPTYGVTFFVVKEKQKDKKKLVPRLLGINSQSILRLDEVSKEILQSWPLTHVKTYHAGKSQFFTLNFGDYSDKEYSVKTKDAYRIREILEGYIDIIRKRMMAKPLGDTSESMVICHDNIQTGQSNIIQHVSQSASKSTTEMFVGPTKILPYDQGSQAQQGTQIMTVQQIVVTDHLQNQQHALKGEVPLRGDMSQECVRKLNRMNSNSVKVVTLLTDPTDVNVKDVQKIVANMQEDFPEVEKGVKETAEKQTIEEAKKMLQDELQDLKAYLNKLTESTKQGQVNPSDAKEAAENIADLTTQLYFSIDPKTRRRSEMLRRSRKSFKEGEKTERAVRRASFITASTTALQAVDNAAHALNEEYNGPKLDKDQQRKLEKALEDRMGKLNAAIALYLTAHSDPENVDYSAAINSMNDINELMPDLARDARILASTKDPAGRKELLDEMRTLLDATKKVCGMNGTEDHDIMQEATNNYADVANKLIFTFARGTNADKENEIIELAKTAGDKTSVLLAAASELSGQCPGEPAVAHVDEAKVRTAGAARDLLACAQLTAPAIHEPHCRSALWAAGAALAGRVQQLEAGCRPLLEHPARGGAAPRLHGLAADVHRALDRLKEAYGAGGTDGADDASLPQRERQRLKFINSMAGAKNKLQAVEDLWSQSATGSPSEQDRAHARRRLSDQMSQLNAAVAALAAATADRDNPDYATAELAINTISELMPQIVKDTEVASSDKDEATRGAMLKNVRALAHACRDMCGGEGPPHGEAVSDFAAASGKLVFLISPGADKGKQKYIGEVSAIAHEQMSELVSQARSIKEQLEPAAAAELDSRCARAAEAAQALLTVAQVTAPSMADARCQDALSSSVQRGRQAAAGLVDACRPHLQQEPAQDTRLLDTQRRLEDSLDKLAHVIHMEPDGTTSESSPAEQEKQRLKFVNSTSGAKKRLDAAEKHLNQPLVCQLMSPEAGDVLQEKIKQRLAQLNAAVAALAVATSDRENPDYLKAEEAVATISELVPEIVKDSRALCGTKTDAEQADMLHELRALCDASRELCASAGEPQGVGDAAAKFSAASGKLAYLVSPGADTEKENQVVSLSAAACSSASSLLSVVQQLPAQLPPPRAAVLEARGARAADAAQALLTVAQVTASSIDNPQCQDALVAAAERLRGSADQLAASCQPHLQQRPGLQQPLQDSQKELADNLDKLVHACKSSSGAPPGHAPSAQQEKQRLKFISSMAGAKNRLDAAGKQLNEPVVCQLMSPEAGDVLQEKLSQRLAQLNAATAALVTATADRENPDFAAADQAVKTITDVMPQVIQDSRTMCGTKDAAGQAALLQDLKALCEATRELCDNAGEPQGLSEAASKFSAASGKLVFLMSPKAVAAKNDAREKQVIELSAAACGKASELLAQVQQLSTAVPEPAAGELDARGAKTADAAQALLTVAQVTAPSISSPSCAAALSSAAERLRGSAASLAASCRPHLQQLPALQQPLADTRQQLEDRLDKLVRACQESQQGSVDEEASAQEEKKRLKFISSVSGAKNRLDAAEKQLSQPVVCQLMSPEAGVVLQEKLSQRLAQLNAAIAALVTATADRENPDYPAADKAINSISELLPQVVQDSRTLCGTKDDAGQAAMLKDLRTLCEASRELCDNSVQQEGLGDAVTKFSAASGKLVFLLSPVKDNAKGQEVIALSAAACSKASELLAQVQQLSTAVPEPAAGELDARGAKTADAAQALLSVAQVTAASISSPSCGTALSSAASQLRSSAQQLAESCAPHVPAARLQQLQDTRGQLDDCLDKLAHACYSAQQLPAAVLSPQQDKQRIKFVSSVSGARNHLDAAEQQLKQPMLKQLLKQDDSDKLQQQLVRRLAQVNAAVAALTAATSDGKNPDYPAAERAVITITELMPLITQDSRTLCSAKDAAGQAAMMQSLADLCDASRAICNTSGQPKELNEASAKLAKASGKLLFIVSPGQKAHEKQTDGSQASGRPAPGPKPPVPSREPREPRQPPAARAPPAPPRSARDSQAFLDTLRCEETHENEARVVTMTRIDDEKNSREEYAQVIDNVQKQLETAEKELKLFHNAKTISMGGKPISAVEVANREQHMEDTLARAGVEVAAVVAANYANKLDYKAATEPTIALTKAVKSIVDDGCMVSGSLHEDARKAFIKDMLGLCQATNSICQAAKSDQEKLNDAAISFGDQSAKLLRVVSSDVNPALEKELISRAKAIGDTASRLALEASNVASSDSIKEGEGHVQDICTAGAQCVDAAGKLVYTAKLVAPTIHHSTCQDAIISSADSLTSSLATFSNTWKPLASSANPNVQKLTEESRILEGLLDKLKSDVKAGKLGKRRDVGRLVLVDTPLRQMTVQIIDNAKNMAEHGEMTPELKKEYTNYSSRLTEALKALDLANARYQRAAHDKEKREQMDMAIQDLQVTLLQTRPSRAGQEQNNIVDFRDFLQDLAKEAEDLQKTSTQNQGPVGKRTTEDITLFCSKIREDTSRLLNPTEHEGDGLTVMTNVDDIMDIDQFGQECDVLVKEINAAIQGIHDQKAKQALRAKALPLTESCNLLRFATNCHISATKSAAYDEALSELDNFEATVINPLVNDVKTKKRKEKRGAAPRRAAAGLQQAARRAARGEPQPLSRALARYTAAAAGDAAPEDFDPLLSHLNYVLGQVQEVTSSSCLKLANWDPHCTSDFSTNEILKGLNDCDYKSATKKLKYPVLSEEDVDKLLLCQGRKVEGTQKQLEDKVQQLSTMLSSMSGNIVLSVKSPESLARSLHAAADVAAQLADTARGLKDPTKPVQCKRIEDAAQEMCQATYTVMKTSEITCQNPSHHDARRKLMDACRHLNDTINQLVRSVNPSSKVSGECGELQRGLQLQRSLLQAPQPSGPLPYAHCLDTLLEQRDVLQKLNSDQAMSREEFMKSLLFVTSAVSNSTDCAAQASYLLAVSEKDQSIGKEGIVDVSKLHKSVEAVQDTCVSIIMTQHEEQIKEEKTVLESQVQDFLANMDVAIKMTKPGDLKNMLKECREEVQRSAKAFYNAVDQNKPKDVTMPLVTSLMDDLTSAADLIEHPDLVPTAGELSADTKANCDEVTKSSLELLKNTEDLIKQVKTSPEQPEVMKWVMFSKRKDVLDAFEALLKSVKSTGQKANLLEAATEDPEEEKKSYVQQQFDTASKWLLKPAVKAEVKTKGQQAVRNLIEVAHKVMEDLKGSEKEDMRHMILEAEQLMTECCKKYDHEQYSVLMERVRDLKKGIERGVVTRVVEDFMEAEAPLADLDILADAEKDETKRKFLLERKIADLLAHLGRVTKTARLIAHTDSDTRPADSCTLNQCSQQAELLAPMLVKAAQQRVESPDDKVAIENYKSMLAKYAESLSKIRDLCDQSVDPMDFVQTAGETMQRMREESTKHNDPMKCALASTAITKLANRVIHVGLSSSSARADPELQAALSAAQAQLRAAAPAPGTRASRLPDWRDHTAKILQATEEVESLLGGETIFNKQPEPNQPIYNEALNLHVAIRDWSSRDNEIVAVAKRMAVLMAKLSNFMNNDKQREVLTTSKSIVLESHEVARLAKKLAHECTDHRIKTNLLQTCERIPTISGQLKMLTTVKGVSLGRHGTQEDIEAMDMLVGNAQSLMLSIQDVVKVAASASVKIMSQRGPRMRWVRRKTSY